jgi:hypothetical protein
MAVTSIHAASTQENADVTNNMPPPEFGPAEADAIVAHHAPAGWKLPTVHPVRATRVWVAAVPVALVNVVAFFGQLAFLRAHLAWPLAGQILVGVALESVAVYLAYHAHLAQVANDSALRLFAASRGFALVIGAMNYSHYAGPGWRPTFPAVAFALMSAASPWLWGVHTHRESRDDLMARGLVEEHAVRLGATRWTWHPFRSAHVTWLATWNGENRLREALALLDAAKLPPLELDAAMLSVLSNRERLIAAFGATGSMDIPAARALLKKLGVDVDQSAAYKIRQAIEAAQAQAQVEP